MATAQAWQGYSDVDCNPISSLAVLELACSCTKLYIRLVFQPRPLIFNNPFHASMAVQYIKCDWLALPGGKLERFFFITLQGDKITSIAQGGSPDYPENCDQYVQAHLVIPGFIDLHTHGVGMQITLNFVTR